VRPSKPRNLLSHSKIGVRRPVRAANALTQPHAWRVGYSRLEAYRYSRHGQTGQLVETRDQYGFTLHPREPSFQVSSCCVRGKEDERPCGYCLLAGTNAKPSSVNIGVVARSNNNVIDVPMRNAFNLHSCFTHYQEEEHHAYASSKIHSTGTQKCPFSFPQNFLEFTNTTACIHYIQYRPTPFPPFLPLRCTSNYPPYPTGKQIK
jgi:hypothetical protein